MEVVLFKSRFREGLAPETLAEYRADLERMVALADGFAGFLSRKSYTAEDGERMTVVTFENEQAMQAWRNHPEHRAAQRKAREKYYAEYSVQAGTVARAYQWSLEAPAQATPRGAAE
ncbi:MAG: antibiotic biosynthesis monooxygenase [bacterium]